MSTQQPHPQSKTGVEGQTRPTHPPEQQDQHAALTLAAESVALAACQRVRELQLLTGGHLILPLRSKPYLNRLMLEAETGTWFEGIGGRASPMVTLPALPVGRSKDLIRGDDLLLALAGQLSAQSVSPQPAAITPSGKGHRPAMAALPRSLSMVSWLPACRSLRSPPLQWLRAFFCDLRPQQRHVGVDDRVSPSFKQIKLHAAYTLVQEGSQSSCRNFARYGVPQAMRAAVWERALGLPPIEQQDCSLELLCRQVAEAPLLTDMVVAADMAVVSDSAEYFLFEDLLRPVMLAFSRDTSVAAACSVPPHPLLVVQKNVASIATSLEAVAAAGASREQQHLSNGQSTASPTHPAASQHMSNGGARNPNGDPALNSTTQPRNPNPQPALSAFKVDIMPDGSQRPSSAPVSVLYPPSGVLPFQGQVLHAAPLCYLYSSPSALYRMYRTMYCRYWCGLHSLSPSHGALPMLCKMTEDVLQVLDPTVVSHLKSLFVPPASLVLPWLTSAFVGFLPVNEVLLLWDRVLGLDSLLPLPLLAVAVLCFRRQVILACRCPDELREVMMDLSKLQTVSLLQAVLFEG